jgi:hypothetical protein
MSEPNYKHLNKVAKQYLENIEKMRNGRPMWLHTTSPDSEYIEDAQVISIETKPTHQLPASTPPPLPENP